MSVIYRSQTIHGNAWSPTPVNVVLVRFRKYIEQEPLSSDITGEFLKSAPHWWLLTTNPDERDHALHVLSRLFIQLRLAEDEEDFKKIQES